MATKKTPPAKRAKRRKHVDPEVLDLAPPDDVVLDLSPKFTPERCAKIIELVRRGNFRETACAQAGVSGRALRNWLAAAARGEEKFVAFVDKLETAEAEAENILVVACRKGAIKDWRAAAWLLERRGSKRWGYKAQVEFTVDEALENILDVAESVLGGAAAAKLFTALASRAEGRGAFDAPARRSPSEREVRGGGSGPVH
jgi:hypothetical protein